MSRKTTPTDIVGEFIKSIFAVIWFFIVMAFYMILPWIFFYWLMTLGISFK